MARNLPKFKDEETRLLIKVYATKESYKARYPYTNGNSFLQKVVGALVSAGYEGKTLGQLNNKIAYMKRHYKHQLKIVQDGGVSHWKFFEDMKRDRWNNFDENISVKQERSSPELQDPVPTTSRASTQVLDLSSKQKRKFYE